MRGSSPCTLSSSQWTSLPLQATCTQAPGAILLVCPADTTFEDDPEFRLARKQYALLRIHVKEARQLAATLDRLPDLFAEVIQRDKM